MSYIKVPDFTKRAGMTRNVLYVNYKNMPKLSQYMKKVGHRWFIDDIVFKLRDEKRNQEERCRELYYAMTENISATELSRRIAAKSEKYPSVKSWLNFIHFRMWMLRYRFFDFLKKDRFDEMERILNEMEE